MQLNLFILIKDFDWITIEEKISLAINLQCFILIVYYKTKDDFNQNLYYIYKEFGIKSKQFIIKLLVIGEQKWQSLQL